MSSTEYLKKKTMTINFGCENIKCFQNAVTFGLNDNKVCKNIQINSNISSIGELIRKTQDSMRTKRLVKV